jgi:membrane associated rhomboid family serine protease
MIPLGDIDRRPLSFPYVTAIIIGLNCLVFVFELIGGERFILSGALIPVDIVEGTRWHTLLTAMFMHGGFLHIGGNMIYLWAFGPEIEDVMGRSRYLVFYMVGGLAAFVAQILINPVSAVPVLGASGAIATIMGAFLITFPHDRIRTIIFLGWFITISFIPAIFLVGFWFVIQLFSGFGSVLHKQSGGVAYIAHIGGFVFGMVVARLFEPRDRRARRSL